MLGHLGTLRRPIRVQRDDRTRAACSGTITAKPLHGGRNKGISLQIAGFLSAIVLMSWPRARRSQPILDKLTAQLTEVYPMGIHAGQACRSPTKGWSKKSPLLGFALLVLSLLFDLPLWAVVSLQLLFFLSVGRVSSQRLRSRSRPHGRSAGTASALMGATQSAPHHPWRPRRSRLQQRHRPHPRRHHGHRRVSLALVCYLLIRRSVS